MTLTTPDLPDLEQEARRLTDHLGNLATVNNGLGAAATRVENAVQALGSAHDALRATGQEVDALNDSASAALAAIDRLRPDQLRSTVESGFANVRSDAERLQQLIVAELDGIARELGEQGAAQSERDQVIVKSVADAALRTLDGIDQTQQRIAADRAAAQQAFAQIREEHAAMAAALAGLQQRQQALAEQTPAIVASIDAIKATAETTRKSVATIEMDLNGRLPALAAELQTLRAQLATQTRGNLIRQCVFFVAAILLIALLNGMLVRFAGVR
jgi:chromosome segregation ATPase